MHWQILSLCPGSDLTEDEEDATIRKSSKSGRGSRDKDLEELADIERKLEQMKLEEERRKSGSGSGSRSSHFDDGSGPRCPEHLFQCGSRECVPPSHKCDGHNDCSDGSDEKGCLDVSDPNWRCPRNLYTCANKECILQQYRCNGRGECTDGSDEWDCADTSLPKKPTTTHGQQQQKADTKKGAKKTKGKKKKKAKKNKASKDELWCGYTDISCRFQLSKKLPRLFFFCFFLVNTVI